MLLETTGTPGRSRRRETLNPPAPPGGGRRVGYPRARGGRPDARPPRRAEVEVPGCGPSPVHRTGSGPRRRPKGAPTSGPPAPSHSELRETGRGARCPGGEGETPCGRDKAQTKSVWPATRRPAARARTPATAPTAASRRRTTARGGGRDERPVRRTRPGMAAAPRAGRRFDPPAPALGIRRQRLSARLPRERDRAKPVMILPQVHLRKPCYDFYFL